MVGVLTIGSLGFVPCGLVNIFSSVVIPLVDAVVNFGCVGNVITYRAKKRCKKYACIVLLSLWGAGR